MRELHDSPLTCKINGKLSLFNFGDFPQTNRIRLELIEEIENYDVFLDKERQMSYLLSSGFFSFGQSSHAQFGVGRSLKLDDKKGVYIQSENSRSTRMKSETKSILVGSTSDDKSTN